MLIRQAVLSRALEGNGEHICKAAVEPRVATLVQLIYFAREPEEVTGLSGRLENYCYFFDGGGRVGMRGVEGENKERQERAELFYRCGPERSILLPSARHSSYIEKTSVASESRGAGREREDEKDERKSIPRQA